MARIRTIKPQFWDDLKLSKLTRDARLLYIGLWNFCDDLGVIPAEPSYSKSKIFPYDQIQIQQYEKWLVELHQKGFINQFSHRSEDFYYLPSLSKHQRIDRPNYTDVFVQKSALDALKSTFDDCSTIDRGTFDDQSLTDSKGKERNINKEEGLTPFEIAFKDFLEMRKKIKKPATEKAIKLLHGKLEELSKGETSLKIKILEQSTINGYQDVWPLRHTPKQQKQSLSTMGSAN